MSILKHFLFFKLESDLDFKKLKDSFCIENDKLYKLDVIDNELFFLQANNGKKDIEYITSSDKFEEVKSKSLKYKRAVSEGQMLEKFDNFYVCTSIDSSKCNGLAFNEYEKLKLTLTYGLKARDLGISIGLALRIYLFYLNINERNDEIKELLSEFAFIFKDNIVNTLINSNNDFLANLSCIVLDNDSFYTNDCAKVSFSKIFAKVLRLNAVKTMKKVQNNDKLIMLLRFLEFYKLNKKLDFLDDLTKKKNCTKIAKKISKYSRKYYIG